MPRASTQPQPVDLASLINSTTYPPVPSLDDLEALRASITDRRKRANVRLKELDPKVADEIRKERQEKKRRENDMTQAWEEKKRAKAEAEAAAAAQAQAREQGQAQSQGMGMGQGSQGQGSGRGERDEEAKVKRERMTGECCYRGPRARCRRVKPDEQCHRHRQTYLLPQAAQLRKASRRYIHHSTRRRSRNEYWTAMMRHSMVSLH